MRRGLANNRMPKIVKNNAPEITDLFRYWSMLEYIMHESIRVRLACDFELDIIIRHAFWYSLIIMT